MFELVDVKEKMSSQYFFVFELGGITKELITRPAGDSELYFPSTSMLKAVGETKLTVKVIP